MALRGNLQTGPSSGCVLCETGQPGHPDQFLYIDSGLLIVQNPPSWAWVCYLKKGESKILLVQVEPRQEKLKKKKKIYIYIYIS